MCHLSHKLYSSYSCNRMGWDRALAFLPYGERFRKHRKMIQQHFNAQAVIRFQSLQRTEIYILLNNLLKSPEAFDNHIRRFVKYHTSAFRRFSF